MLRSAPLPITEAPLCQMTASAYHVTLSPVALGFAVATTVVDRNSLLEESSTADARRHSCAEATTTTAITATTVTTITTDTEATYIAITATASGYHLHRGL